MAAELMLINPRRRRKHRRRARAARVTHARRNPRRRRRMSALQEQYFGKGRRRRSGGRRRRIIRATSNPRRRRRHRHSVLRMRRNPSVNNPVNFVSETLVPAGVGAVGGIAVNYIFDNYAPASLQTGILNPVSRLALAALVGMGVGMVTDNRTGAMAAAGAMTVTVYDMIENYMSGQGVFAQGGGYGGGYSQGGYGYGGNQTMGRFLGRRRVMGKFLKGRGMGYMSPARQMGRFVR